MIFAHTLHQVMCGEKRQTRRLRKLNETFDLDRQAIIKSDMRVMYQVGRSYAVQPNRGQKAVGRILLTGIRKERLDSITHVDALQEGFTSRDHFLTTWYKIHGHRADIEREVWVFAFELDYVVEESAKVFAR